jgi:putative Holliday junction resolvase
MRVLGIDHGTVRIGLALSDELRVVARPFETVAEADAIRRIVEIIREQNVGALVLGLPLRLDGSEGPAAARVRTFFGVLRPQVPAEIPIHLRDESLTTLEATAHLRAGGDPRTNRHDVIDQVAAAVILQEFLDETIGPAVIDEQSAEEEP